MLVNLLKRRCRILEKSLAREEEWLSQLRKTATQEEIEVRRKAKVAGYPHGGEIIEHNHHALAVTWREVDRLKRRISRLRWWIKRLD